MKIIDISLALNEKTVVWPADAAPQLKPILRTPKDPVNFTWLDFGAHAGTHVDAPFFLYGDKWTADQIPFERVLGSCQVLDLTYVESTITRRDIERQDIRSSRVLLKTKNSFDPMQKYNPQHVDMEVDAARALVERGVQTLGYDYLSFEREGRNAVHEVFLSRDIIVIDNLRLADADAREYLLIALPVKLTGTDGAPVRAVLVEGAL